MKYAFSKTDEYTQYAVIVDGQMSCKYDYYVHALSYAKDVLHIKPNADVRIYREVVSINRINLL